jgi:hypothetical protein
MTRGKIVLTPFPFTDLSGGKVRPAVVVSNSLRGGADVILAFISTSFDTASLSPTAGSFSPDKSAPFRKNLARRGNRADLAQRI